MGGVPTFSRRAFLGGGQESRVTIRPPGVAVGGLKSCTGCGGCVDACPTRIVSLVGGIPALDLAHGECTFCGECRRACPEPVFGADTPSRFPNAVAISASCFAKSGIACQSCSDVCPEQAIRFRPRIGGPFLPEIDENACSGCGACIGACPAGAIGVTQPGKEEVNA